MENGPGRCSPESQNHDHAENIKSMNNYNNNNNVWRNTITYKNNKTKQYTAQKPIVILNLLMLQSHNIFIIIQCKCCLRHDIGIRFCQIQQH